MAQHVSIKVCSDKARGSRRAVAVTAVISVMACTITQGPQGAALKYTVQVTLFSCCIAQVLTLHMSCRHSSPNTGYTVQAPACDASKNRRADADWLLGASMLLHCRRRSPQRLRRSRRTKGALCV